MAEARVTKAGTYAELSGAAVFGTKAGVYVEIEVIIPMVRASLAGVYIEMVNPNEFGTSAYLANRSMSMGLQIGV